VWLDVLAYTGLRRGDVVRIGRQHVRNGVATVKTEKNKQEVTLPILPTLQQTLDAGPTGDLTFIAGANGRPMTKESFGNEFKSACKEAGVPGSAHGVRKIAATPPRRMARRRRSLWRSLAGLTPRWPALHTSRRPEAFGRRSHAEIERDQNICART
jgi:integrase